MASSTAASPDVLVAGAGPAGSAVAIRLARAGLRVLLVDRATFPRDKPCADYLSPGALRALGALGLRERVEALGAPLDGIAVEAPRGSRLVGRFAEAAAAPRERHGRCLARRELDALLVDAARDAGVEVAERTSVEAVVHTEGGVGGAVVRDADGRRRVVPARVTVGADGLRSVVARCIGGRTHSVPRRVAFVGHFETAGADGHIARMVVSATGYAGINPLGGGIANVALVVPANLAAGARGDAEGFMRARLAALPGIGPEIARARIVRKVLVTGPFAARSRRLVTGGAALVGDAADFFDPFTGEGVCSALRGAELLASRVAVVLGRSGPVRARDLAPYVAARRRAFAGKWCVERLIGGAMTFPRLFERAVARIGRRGLAHTLVGVTGEFVPAGAVLNPSFLARAVL